MSSNIIGHQKLQSRLINLVSSGKLPQSLIFAGPAGIGKKLVALKLVSTLACEASSAIWGGCGKCHACQLLEHGNYPDLRVITASDKESVDLDSIRDDLNSLNLKAYLGKVRALVFDDAENLSPQAMNLMLKNVEEPRPATYFIFITSNPAQLLPTLVSRCQRWYFDSLEEDEVVTILRAQGREAGVAYASLADGSLSNLNLILNFGENWQTFQTDLKEISQGRVDLAIDLTKRLTADKAALPIMLDFMRIFARQRLFDPTTTPIGQHLWANLLQNSIVAKNLLSDRHLNANAVIGNLLLALASPAPDGQDLLSAIAV